MSDLGNLMQDYETYEETPLKSRYYRADKSINQMGLLSFQTVIINLIFSI